MTLPAYRAEWLTAIRSNAPACEALRPQTRKPTLTGTISEAACLYLRAIVERIKPRVCVEIGTFIGTSALVLASTGARVYTCDKDNAAFASTGTITSHGRTTSTEMLTGLCQLRPSVDLWFFDGRIQDVDLPMIHALSSPSTVFAFDDYIGHEKGVINVDKLRPMVPSFRVIPPPARVGDLASATTIALLVPGGWA